MNKPLILAILRAWALVGTLDWMGAVSVFILRGGTDPQKVFIFIASGAMGSDAGTGEPWIPYVGFLFHYLIALTWTVIFFLSYPRIPFLRSSPPLVGIIYGAIIWVTMNLVVLPLSKIPPLPFVPTSALIGASVLMVCIGIPLAFRARKHYRTA